MTPSLLPRKHPVAWKCKPVQASNPTSQLNVEMKKFTIARELKGNDNYLMHEDTIYLKRGAEFICDPSHFCLF